jgi:hypothetical protein
MISCQNYQDFDKFPGFLELFKLEIFLTKHCLIEYFITIMLAIQFFC